MPAKLKDDPHQIPLFADILPAGDGTFRLIPRKPVLEVGPAKAAQILNVSPSSLPNLLDRPLAQKHIRWRWLSDAKGKRLYDTASLHEYKKATQDSELPKGESGKKM